MERGSATSLRRVDLTLLHHHRSPVKTTVWGIVFLLFLTYFLPAIQAQEVSVPDPGLNAAIREALQKPSDPLTVQDLLSLTNLDAASRGVLSLDGLGAASNLVTLRLDFNPVTDLTLPNGLISLQSLSLYANEELTNLTLPTGITNVQSLDLTGTALTDFSFLNDRTSLRFLGLGYTMLTDFSFLGGLTRLQRLDLNNDHLTNFALPIGLTNRE